MKSWFKENRSFILFLGNWLPRLDRTLEVID